MGQTITHIGASGAGQVAKACNQIAVGVGVAAVAEIMKLAQACNVDPAPVRAALLGGFAQSKVLDIHGQRMIDDNYAPGFKAKLHARTCTSCWKPRASRASSCRKPNGCPR